MDDMKTESGYETSVLRFLSKEGCRFSVKVIRRNGSAFSVFSFPVNRISAEMAERIRASFEEYQMIAERVLPGYRQCVSGSPFYIKCRNVDAAYALKVVEIWSRMIAGE